MKEVILKRIQLTNWRGLNLDVAFNNAVTNISATNGVGKTSLQTSWNWLLSGFTTPNEPKNCNLFDNKFEIDENTPEASVKAWVTINGIEYTLQKTAKAKFTRKRGTNEYVKDSSDVYKTFIDDIEYSSVDYADWISANICSADKLEYCLDGLFLVALAEEDKKKARKVLEDIVGEIKAEDFKGDYSCLANDFAKGYTIEQIEEKTKRQIKNYKDMQISLPILIADKESKLAELNAVNYNDIENAIKEKRNAISNIDNALLGKNESIQPIIDKRNEIVKMLDEKLSLLSKQEYTYNEQRNAVIGEIKSKINEINIRNSGVVARNAHKDNEKALAKRRYESEMASLKGLIQERDLLRKERDEIKAMVFTDDCCSMCGQPLPEDMLADAKNKFLTTKQAKLDAVVAKGKAVTQKIVMWEKITNDLEIDINKDIVYEKEESTSVLEEQLKNLESNYVSYKETDEYKSLVREIEELKVSMPEIPQNDNNTLLIMKNGLLNELEDLSKKLAKKDNISELSKEINDLNEQCRIVGIDLAKLEGIIDKCKEMVEEQASIVSFRINEKLKDCKIRMWDRQKNGELVPSCTILDKKGVKYTTTNNAERIKICLSLQQLMCNHFEITMPLWVDESSIFASNNLPKFDSQTIYMFASNDTTLNVQ